jgi:hypothetical protein
MFDSVDELIEENDRRRTLELDAESDGEFQTEHTLEFGYFISRLPCVNLF